MDIKDIQAIKKDVEISIGEHIAEQMRRFEEKTGLVLDGVYIHDMPVHAIGHNTPVNHVITVELRVHL